MRTGGDLVSDQSCWSAGLKNEALWSSSHNPVWLLVLQNSMRHVPYLIEGIAGGQVEAVLPLSFVNSWLFGRFLVSLPYVKLRGNSRHARRDDTLAVGQGGQFGGSTGSPIPGVKAGTGVRHDALTQTMSSKVHMRLPLPETKERLWNQLKDKVRNQIRKGRRQGFKVLWGHEELLGDFHRCSARNMRDLGTPVYGRRLFQEILQRFPKRSRTVRCAQRARSIAAALLLHGA